MINTFWNFKCLKSSRFLYLPQEGIQFKGLRNDSIVMMPQVIIISISGSPSDLPAPQLCILENRSMEIQRDNVSEACYKPWREYKCRVHVDCFDSGLHPMLLWFWQILHTFYCQLDISYVTSIFSLPGMDEDTVIQGHSRCHPTPHWTCAIHSSFSCLLSREPSLSSKKCLRCHFSPFPGLLYLHFFPSGK